MLVKTTIKDRICFVEMQNPEHFNCLSHEMCTELVKAIQKGYDKECVGIVIKAKCNKGVWSAGHDINELPRNGEDPLAYDVPMEKLLRKVQEIPIPVIACVCHLRHHSRQDRHTLQRFGHYALHQPARNEQGKGDVLPGHSNYRAGRP